eukprot:11182696-Alexandrium_andersonii.AAC.1
MEPRLGVEVAEPQPREGDGGIAVLDQPEGCLRSHVPATSQPQPWRASEPSSVEDAVDSGAAGCATATIACANK